MPQNARVFEDTLLVRVRAGEHLWRIAS